MLAANFPYGSGAFKEARTAYTRRIPRSSFLIFVLAHGAILRRERPEIFNDLVEDIVRESGAKHFKGFYIISF